MGDLFNKIAISLDGLLPQLDYIASYRDPLIRKSLQEESISVLASEGIFYKLIEEGSYRITSKGEEAIGSLKTKLSDKEFLKDNIIPIIFKEDRLIPYHNFFSKTLLIFKNLFRDNEIKKEVEKNIEVSYSIILFVAAVFTLQKGKEFQLIYEA